MEINLINLPTANEISEAVKAIITGEIPRRKGLKFCASVTPGEILSRCFKFIEEEGYELSPKITSSQEWLVVAQKIIVNETFLHVNGRVALTAEGDKKKVYLEVCINCSIKNGRGTIYEYAPQFKTETK